MKFVFAGGAREVGGSCIYLRVQNHGILMDCGIRQGADKDPLPDFRSIQEAGGVDAILISHAHMDHTGSLPVLSKEYPAASIYMTPSTMDLTRILLADSIKIMNRSEGTIPFYGKEDVEEMMKRVVPVPFQTPYEIFDGYEFTFYPAGHIAGAACIYLKTPEGTVFYSGDVSGFAQETIEGIRIPRLRPDIGLFESTYGNRLHANRQAEESKLVETVKECVEDGKKVLIPSFALGRAQEVLLILQRAMKNKQIPEVPVYVDGMVTDITQAYLNHPSDLRASVARKIFKGQNPFYSDLIQPVLPSVKREDLVKKQGPAVFVASSGMLTGGPSLTYAKALVPDADACIIITGYQDEDAPGRTLLSMMEDKEEKSITLDGALLPVKCRVVQVGLSAHSDKSELLALVDQLSCRRIILVHGEEDAMNELGSELSKDYRIRVYKPSTGSELHFDITRKREQLSQAFTYTMHGTDFSDPSEQKALYDFWDEHYHGRSFTPQELYNIYAGKEIHLSHMQEEEKNAMDTFMHALDESAYFSRDARRMFLFRRNTEEEVKNLAKKNEPQIQDVEEIVKGILKDTKVRRLSYYQDTKTVRIVSDFPDAFDRDLLEKINDVVSTETGWRTELSPSVNHQAMGALLSSMFPGRILKTSYYEDRKEYVLQLSGAEEDDARRQEEFHRITGWKLSLSKGEAADTGSDSSFVIPPEGTPMEQNEAISYIRQKFLDQPSQPYRISIKTDQYGRYLELTFISPAVGHRYDALIQQCVEDTRWRMKVSDAVNQNEAQLIAARLSSEYGVHSSKQASYRPQEKAMELKTADEIPDEMKEKFEELTGLSLRKKS